MSSGDRNLFDDPLLLNPDEYRGTDEALANRDPLVPVWDPDLRTWVAPFFMAPINTRVVRRSHALSSQWQRPYGDKFRYQEYLGSRRAAGAGRDDRRGIRHGLLSIAAAAAGRRPRTRRTWAITG